MTNSLLLFAEAVVYFGVMAALFRWRGRIGIGVFLCALGVMHFLETYLAAVFYVALPFGMVSPGSSVMFSGKLVMLLLLYIKEDAALVRQPIYGLLVGNALMVALVLLLRLHEVELLPNRTSPEISFIDEMGWLMVWGTTLLYVDSILIILLYEKLGRYLRKRLFLRVAICTASILTFDQLGFYVVLHLLNDAPPAVFFGGWYAKMIAAVTFSGMLVCYLHWFEPKVLAKPRGITDVFDTLTYRERYESLLEHAARDGLTGLMHRGRFETLGEQAVANALAGGHPLSLLIIDADDFKAINDSFGHAEGDRVLRALAALLAGTVEEQEQVFRIGGEEFAVICPYPHAMARLLGEKIRQAVQFNSVSGVDGLSVSVGVATVGPDTGSLAELFSVADSRLYAAKAAGRNRVIGDAEDPAQDRRVTHLH